MLSWLQRRLLTPLFEAYWRWSEDDGAHLAAAVAYYAALSFFPLVMVLLSAAGFVMRSTGWGADADQRWLEVLSEQVSPQLADQVGQLVNSIALGASVGGPLGLLGVVIASMAIFTEFETAFARIWRLPEPAKKGFLGMFFEIVLHRLRAFLMLLFVGVLAVAAFLFSMGLSTLQTLAQQWLPGALVGWPAMTLMVAVVINCGLFTLIYKMLPKAQVRWREALEGGLLASAIWEIGRRVLTMALVHSQYNAYGLVGAFIAIMLWVYYAAASLFFGAEYVRVLWSMRRKEGAGVRGQGLGVRD